VPSSAIEHRDRVPCILIVDDDEPIVRLIRLFLQTSGYDTMSASNGAEALEQMRQRRPCLVLLDVQMPVMDGFAFREHQMADSELSAVPVVCLTAHYEPEQVTMRLGVHCLRKPPHFPEILDAVEARCGHGKPSR
jgi:CheY-like chemotaxis protein